MTSVNTNIILSVAYRQIEEERRKMYMIKDWAGNLLNHNGHFVAPNLAAAMQFDSFDDAWEWIYQNIPDNESYDDIYAVTVG